MTAWGRRRRGQARRRPTAQAMDVQVVGEFVEGRLGDDEFAVGERQFVGALAGDPVPLATAGGAELLGRLRPPVRPGGLGGTSGSAAIPS